MNPVDHPHGGGEGKSSGGHKSKTPWGKLTKGRKTVKYKKKSLYSPRSSSTPHLLITLSVVVMKKKEFSIRNSVLENNIFTY